MTTPAIIATVCGFGAMVLALISHEYITAIWAFNTMLWAGTHLIK